MKASRDFKGDIDWALKAFESAVKDECSAKRNRDEQFTKLHDVIHALLSENDRLRAEAELRGGAA